MPSEFEKKKERLGEINPEAILFDGLEDALIGICNRYGQPSIALYDYEKCIEIFMRDGGSYEEAVEHFDYNTIGTWAGENTPAFMHRLND